MELELIFVYLLGEFTAVVPCFRLNPLITFDLGIISLNDIEHFIELVNFFEDLPDVMFFEYQFIFFYWGCFVEVILLDMSILFLRLLSHIKQITVQIGMN